MRDVVVLLLKWLGLTAYATIFVAAFAADCWPEQGNVEALRGELLVLRGAPGDQIKLALPLPVDERTDYRELTATLRHPASDGELQVSIPAQIEHLEEEDEGVYGRFVVPDLPVGVDVSGTLAGRERLSDGETATLNIPMALHVLAPGEGEQSGYRDTTLQTRLIVVVVAVVVWALLPVMFLLILATAQRDTQLSPQRSWGDQ
jgi:hypothetical protein